MQATALLLTPIFLFCGCDIPKIENTTIYNQYTEEATSDLNVLITNLGKPFEQSYRSNNAKNPWDMIIYDGKLFIGSGDYDKNTGSCQVACYDLQSREFSLDTLPDEMITKFTILNKNLYAPGIDPTDSWDLGNYYVYSNGGWEVHRYIPNGIHTFSLAEFEGKIFAALGTEEGLYPVTCAELGQNNFHFVPFYKNGTASPVSNSAKDRVYDLFVLNDRLFAFKTSDECQVFLYQKNRFEYYDSWLYKITFPQVDFLKNLQDLGGFFSSVTHENIYYFTTGYLFKTTDGKNVEYLSLDGSQYVLDLYQNKKNLYALGVSKTENGDYISTVYSIDGKNVRCLFSIREKTFAISLAVSDNDYYFGFGYSAYDSQISGSIIKYTYNGD